MGQASEEVILSVVQVGHQVKREQKTAAPETEPPKTPKGAPTQPNTSQRHRRSGPKTTIIGDATRDRRIQWFLAGWVEQGESGNLTDRPAKSDCVVVLPPLPPKGHALLFCPLPHSDVCCCCAPFSQVACVVVLPPSPQGHDGCCVVFRSFWVCFGFIERRWEVLGSSIWLLGHARQTKNRHTRHATVRLYSLLYIQY